MSNIKLSHMCHWKTIPYKKIDNFRDFYYEDKSNNCYFMDWDRILRHHRATSRNSRKARSMSKVFRPNRLVDFVRIRSIFPFRQRRIIV